MFGDWDFRLPIFQFAPSSTNSSWFKRQPIRGQTNEDGGDGVIHIMGSLRTTGNQLGLNGYRYW